MASLPPAAGQFLPVLLQLAIHEGASEAVPCGHFPQGWRVAAILSAWARALHRSTLVVNSVGPLAVHVSGA